ncbi:MAG TPA: hypothetical protein VMF69_19590 [Gemmataceae bacterium]|nr:hypothetical protein [Gemmataceae bacterium]
MLVDENGGLIAGCGCVLAGRKLGLTEVPVMVARGWSEAQKRAYVLADNKLALNAEWDDSLLNLEIADLRDMGVDLALTGFGDEEVARLLSGNAGEGRTDPDEVPEVPAQPASVPGDVWLLGRHRLVCGDCTDAHVVERALAGVKPHLMVTDPPYGVAYDPNWRNEASRALDGKATRSPSGNTRKSRGARATGKVLNDDRAVLISTENWVLPHKACG